MRSPVLARVAAGAAALLLLAAGCAPLMGRGGRGGGAGLADKPVASREAPSALIAVDGTRCLVTDEKFQNTVPGDRVWCFWTRDGDGAAATDVTTGTSTRARPADGTPLSGRGTAARRPRATPAPSTSR